MRYRTKKEILGHLGKDGKDVRYLDRAVASGEIIVRDRMYITSKEYIEELEGKLKELKKSEPKCVKTAVEEVIKDIKRDDIEELEKKIKELESENELLRGKVDKNINQEIKVDKNDNLAEMERKFNESESNLEYQISENEKLERRVDMYQECIRRCYLRAQNVKKDKTPRPVFKKEVLKLEWDISWEDNQ